MAYNQNFYDAYENYMKESEVRRAHDFIFSLIAQDVRFNQVIDLGCGQFQEFRVYRKPFSYLGVDAEAPAADIHTDYRALQLNVIDHKPTAFVSLFSSEITAPYKDNYDFYTRIFAELPSIDIGLVSGFYYATKKDVNPVLETGDVISYQTLEQPEDVVQYPFYERRILIPTPSKMFGSDVIEVWKFLERKYADNH